MLIKRHLQTKKKREQLTRIVKGSLVLDIPKFKATVNGTDAELTAKEFALLLLLVQSENKEVPPHELYEKVWGTPSGEDIRTIRFHIKNLRRKIHADDANDYDIVSVYGKGVYVHYGVLKRNHPKYEHFLTIQKKVHFLLCLI